MTGMVLDRRSVPGERELVDLARAGDRAAFERLVAVRLDSLYRTAWTILRNEADARDATQNALIASWRSLPQLNDPERFEAWLQRILVNHCRSALRSRRRDRVRPLDAGDDDRPQGGGREHDRTPDDVAETNAVRRAFERLSVDQRTLIVLHHVEDRSVGEISNVLGVAQGTVKWRLFQARRALERALAEERR